MNGQIGKLERFDLSEPFTAYVERVTAMNGVGDLSREALRRLWQESERMVHYRNAEYHVAIDKDPPHGFPGAVIWHLSIKRHDRAPIMDWRDLQAIKSRLCGDDAEAIQLFPAERRVVDTANQYHLFAFMKMSGVRLPRLPIGWTEGARTDEPGGDAVQRPSAGGVAR